MSWQSLVLANNRFAFNLLAQLATGKPEQNLFISPASINLALAMTANGADQPTELALRKTLRLTDLSWAEINTAQQAVWAELASDDPDLLLALANSLWAEPGFPFDETFQQAVLQFYTAEISNLDFGETGRAAATINEWVAGKTADKIKDLLTAGDLVGATLVLVNAIYFKGLWQRPFSATDTRDGRFHLTDGNDHPLPLMQQKDQFQYQERDQWQMINLPFGQYGRLSMVILLPQATTTLFAQQPQLTATNWQGWMKRLIPGWGGGRWNDHLSRSGRRDGRLVLPRFKLEDKASLLEILQAMGFTSNHFPHMSTAPGDSLFISKIIHQTFLEVKEEGAEAAAATAVMMVRSAMMTPRPFQMIVDRPFLCAIQDNQTGLLLFLGLIYKPEQTA